MNAQTGLVDRDSALSVARIGGGLRYTWNATLTANKVARATAAKRSPGLTITNEE